MEDNNKLASAENDLLRRYQERGYLLEDEVVDCCMDYDLELAEIDVVCDRLLKKNIIFKDSKSDDIGNSEESDVYDRSQLDYEQVLNQLEIKYPSCKYLIEQIRNILPPQHKEWHTLIKEAQSNNAYARERLLLMYLRTIIKKADDFSTKYYCDFEDSFQNAVIGFLNAIEKYDISSPDSFVSYFQWWLVQSMSRECVLKGSIMRYPVHYNEKIMPLLSVLYDSYYSPNRVLSVEKKIIEKYTENEDYSGIYDELFKIFSECFGDEYNQFTVNDINYNHLLPWLAIYDDFESFNCCEENCIKEERSAIIKRNINHCLNEREKYVIINRFGLDDNEGKTLEEVGQKLGVTRERIRQIEKVAIKKLRSRKAKDLKDFYQD